MSQPTRFRKKPIIVNLTAMRFDGDVDDLLAVYKWVEENTLGSFDPKPIIRGYNSVIPKSGIGIDHRDDRVVLATHGVLRHVNKGDWVVRNDRGYFYPCPHDKFMSQYEEAVDA